MIGELKPFVQRYAYPYDVGNLHVIDYYLHKENFGTSPARMIFQPALRFDPSDWTRYDGDLL